MSLHCKTGPSSTVTIRILPKKRIYFVSQISLTCSGSLFQAVSHCYTLACKVLQARSILKNSVFTHKCAHGAAECRKTKTKVFVTLANRKGHRESSEPIKTLSKYMHVADEKRRKTCASEL